VKPSALIRLVTLVLQNRIESKSLSSLAYHGAYENWTSFKFWV